MARRKKATSENPEGAAGEKPAAEPSLSKIGVALVGAGDIGSARAEAVAKTHALKLVTVADLRSESAHEVAQRLGAVATTDWEAAVTRDDVSLVIVSTPPPAHAEVAHRAFAAGKHVLCEKPL
ncbi:MAG TPA: Gfo/Idh/MocA family oxidoreductase, partial [Thermoanaerobaculia bacterium]|nr:Gfo/Idh/MocA family oxidoreductase [Thermoanaerobaculia bacterium]